MTLTKFYVFIKEDGNIEIIPRINREMTTLQKIFNEGLSTELKNDCVVIPKLSAEEKIIYLKDTFPFQNIYLEKCETSFLMIRNFTETFWLFTIWSLDSVHLGSVQISFQGDYESGLKMKIISKSENDSTIRISITDTLNNNSNIDFIVDLEKDVESIEPLLELTWAFHTLFSPANVDIALTLK